MWTYNYSNNDFIAHYGIKGMRWGVRKKSSSKNSKKSKRKIKQAQRRQLKSMSDSDLQNKINRLQNEKKYSKLKFEDEHPYKATANSILDKYAKTVSKVISAAALGYASYKTHQLISEYDPKLANWMIKNPNKK